MSANEQIKYGEIVWLNSGGPKMTFGMAVTTNLWTCQWFENGELKEGKFMKEQLSKTKPATEE